MAAETLTGRGQLAYPFVAGGPLRIHVTDFGSARQMDNVEPIRWMEVGWIAGYEANPAFDDLGIGDVRGPLHWIMFEWQSFMITPNDISGGYDGIVYALGFGVEIVVSF